MSRYCDNDDYDYEPWMEGQAAFAQINSNGGYIGRLAWWNTMDTQAINPHCPVNVRFWGKGPFLLKGWGSAK